MTDEVARALLDLVLLVAAGRLGGWAAERLRQPAVLGELAIGVLLGPTLLGNGRLLPALDAATPRGAAVLLVATVGAALLLFEVGLESDLRLMRRVGASSLLVAVAGVVVSFALGAGASVALSRLWPAWDAAIPALQGNLLHLFVGATFTATSVGITARVLADLGKLRTGEARIILGAAVLDDVAGLLILAGITALVTAAATGSPLGPLGVLRVAAAAFGFLAVSVLLGFRLVPRVVDLAAAKAKAPGALVAGGVAFALAMAYLAQLSGLAAILGAFVAGLLAAPARHAHRLFEEVRPVGALVVPVFVVTLGMRANLLDLQGHAFLALGIGLALAAVAVAAKVACGVGVVRGQASRLVVGVGMVPRGEVGLIVASLGLASGLIATWQFTAILLAVLVTTVVTPPWLRALAGRFTHDASPALAGTEGLGRILEP